MLSFLKLPGLYAPMALAVVLAMFGTSSQAATCKTMNFTTSTDCVSPVTGGNGGNVTETEMNSGTGVFGHTNWLLLDQISDAEIGTHVTSAGGLFKFDYTDFENKDGKYEAVAGTWRLLEPFAWGTGKYAFGIKGSTDNAVYLMDTAFSFGTWTVEDLGGKALSNVQLFGTEDLSQIPLPAAGWLLIGALGGLAALRRKRTAA